MNKAILSVLASLTLLLGVSSASAAVKVIATDTPDTISVGGTVDLTLTIDLSRSAKKYFDPDIVGGFIKVFSGDGQEESLKITPGEKSETFNLTFVYDTPGNYTPKYSGVIFYSEKFKDHDDDDKCKWKDKCDRKVDIDKIYKFDFVHGKFDDPGVSEIGIVNVAAAAPELSTWAMMLIGFAFTGFAAYRRNKKLTASLPTS